MTVDEIIAFAESLGDVVIQQPSVDSPDVPEIARGDSFVYYSTNGEIPPRTQPFTTVVTKNYPGEPDSVLDEPGAFRVNIWVGTDEFTRRLGQSPRALAPTTGTVPTPIDAVAAHPTYAGAGWVCVINPDHAAPDVRDLVTHAHARARASVEKRRPS